MYFFHVELSIFSTTLLFYGFIWQLLDGGLNMFGLSMAAEESKARLMMAQLSAVAFLHTKKPLGKEDFCVNQNR